MKHVDCPPNLRSNPEDGFEVYITTSVVADNAICSKQIYLKFNKVVILLDNEKELEQIGNRILHAVATLQSGAPPGKARVTLEKPNHEKNLS